MLPLDRTGNHIAFVKTHATGSSTLASILHRYAVNHGVAKALPEKASFTYNLDTEPMAKGPKLMQTPKLNCNGTQRAGPPFEMWSNHIVYHSRMDGMSKGGGSPATAVLVPGAKGQVLTIVRDPADRFLSAFYKGNRVERDGRTIQKFIQECRVNPKLARAKRNTMHGLNGKVTRPSRRPSRRSTVFHTRRA